MFFLILSGCNVLIKTPSEQVCESAASTFASCAALSDQLEIPYTYDELSASAACSLQKEVTVNQPTGNQERADANTK